MADVFNHQDELKFQNKLTFEELKKRFPYNHPDRLNKLNRTPLYNFKDKHPETFGEKSYKDRTRRTYIRKPDDQNYGIRLLNPKSLKDIVSVITADIQPETQEFMYPKRPSKLQLYLDYLEADGHNNQSEWDLFAVTDQKNEVIGLIQFEFDERVDQISQQLLIEEDALVLEATYHKLFSKNKRNATINGAGFHHNKVQKGVIVKGLKQCMEIIADGETRPTYITAYTDPKNKASVAVVEKNGFLKLPNQINWDGELSDVWIKKIN